MHTVSQLKNMSKEDIRELNKKLGRMMVNKILVGAIATVVVHYSSEYIIGKIDEKRATNALTE